jgi:hypothetical protein
MTDESLRNLVAASQQRVRVLRQAGDLPALLAAAKDAADDIEQRVGERQDDETCEALPVVRRFMFNTAAVPSAILG